MSISLTANKLLIILDIILFNMLTMLKIPQHNTVSFIHISYSYAREYIHSN